jgi:hypothetical protein
MLVVETIAKIGRAYLVQQKPIKVICRELGLSRKVVRKVLRSDATEFRYTRSTQPLPKIGPWYRPFSPSYCSSCSPCLRRASRPRASVSAAASSLADGLGLSSTRRCRRRSTDGSARRSGSIRLPSTALSVRR